MKNSIRAPTLIDRTLSVGYRVCCFFCTQPSLSTCMYIYICIRIDSPGARFARGCSWRPSVTVKSMGPLTNTKWQQKAVWSNLVDTCPGSSGQYVGHYPTSRGAATAWWQDVLCLIHQQVFKFVKKIDLYRFFTVTNWGKLQISLSKAGGPCCIPVASHNLI